MFNKVVGFRFFSVEGVLYAFLAVWFDDAVQILYAVLFCLIEVASKFNIFINSIVR